MILLSGHTAQQSSVYSIQLFFKPNFYISHHLGIQTSLNTPFPRFTYFLYPLLSTTNILLPAYPVYPYSPYIASFSLAHIYLCFLPHSRPPRSLNILTIIPLILLTSFLMSVETIYYLPTMSNQTVPCTQVRTLRLFYFLPHSRPPPSLNILSLILLLRPFSVLYQVSTSLSLSLFTFNSSLNQFLPPF